MVQAIKIDKSEILSELARSMGIPETQISQRNVLAELIRFAFCSLSSNQERTEAIFVRRLLDYVRARFQFLGENINYEDLIGESIVKSLNVAIRSTMDDLDRTGDISELSGGYWMPLPSRYIHHGETVLVLSSLPTIQITQQSGCKLNAATLVRTTDTTEIKKLASAGFIEQTLISWIGEIDWSPKKLLEDIMARAEADAMIAEVTEPFHVYLPWENVRQKQPFRWTLSTDLKKVPDHFVLCKSFGRSSIPRYWLGKLARDGQYIYAKSEFDVPGHLAVKLQFALDIQHNAKNSVEILDAHGDEFIDIDLILPFEIYRLLRALAIEESRVGKWTRRYKISKEHGQLVRHYLLNLEINLAGEG